ncbi:DUF739 family protein [Fusobacterium varium]
MKNFKKLKGLLLEKGLSYKDVANSLGMSVTSFSNKMNCKTEFTHSEILELSKLLKISMLEKEKIFF